MKNKMVDLRNHLFATLEALQDQDNPMDLDRARTIAVVAEKITDSAKVEVDFIKATGSDGSGFIPVALPAPTVPGEAVSRPTLVHKMK